MDMEKNRKPAVEEKSSGLEAVEERRIGRLDAHNDSVSVVHSGETDPMPNRDAQAAFEEEIPNESVDPYGAGSTDEVLRIKVPTPPDELVHQQRVTEEMGSPSVGDPDASVGSLSDDENDYEWQQDLAEQAGLDNENQRSA